MLKQELYPVLWAFYSKDELFSETCQKIYLQFNISFITVSLFFPAEMVTRQKSI